MKKSLMAFVLALALAATAFAAPRAGDLTMGSVGDANWVGFGVRDMDAFLNRPADSLLARALQLAPIPAAIGKLGAWDARIAASDDFEKIDKFFLAVELKGDVTFDEINMAGNAKPADFTVAAPAGAKVTPLAVVETGDEMVPKVNMAVLERDGAKYLLAASGDPALLAGLAAAPEGNTAVVARTAANVWIQAHAKKDVVELPLDLDCEIGVEDTPTSVRAIVWANVCDEICALAKEELGKDLRAVLTGGAQTKAPLLFGKAPLAALLNVSASFLPEGFKLADIMPAEEAAEAEKEVVEQISQVGFTWEDLVKALRGNLTLGFAGKLNAPMIGEIPGVYLHATGVDAAKVAPLISMGAQQLAGMIGAKAEPYEANGWHGFQLSGMVSGLIAAGENGLLAAAMNADQFGMVEAVEPGMAAAVEPRNFALALNTKELQPVLKNLFEKFGDQLLEMAGEEAKGAKDVIKQVIDNLNLVDAVSLVAADENTFIIEATPNAGLVNMILPAPEPAAVKPAA